MATQLGFTVRPASAGCVPVLIRRQAIIRRPKNMSDEIRAKAQQIRTAMRSLGGRLDDGDTNNLFVWVLPDELACVHRPLRHHPRFGGSAHVLPAEATPAVVEWADQVLARGVKGIICLTHPKELRYYDALTLCPPGLLAFYRSRGLVVRHLPWDDPAHRPPWGRATFESELLHIREEALDVFDVLEKPVAIHCSAGIDRSSPVAAYIWHKRHKASDAV
jgi:hypothetical protein